MRFNYRSLLVPIFLFFAAGLSHAEKNCPTLEGDVAVVHHEQIDPWVFKSSMRMLWEQHVVYTRMFLISESEKLGDQDLVLQRLLQNQVEIGNAVKPFYGEENGNQLSTLLTSHIQIAGELIAALIANKTVEAEAAKVKWVANADEIATFLNAANPEHWGLEDMKMMMHEHLDTTTVEVNAQIAKDYAGSIAAFETVQTVAMKMADVLSTGIMKQFPDKFIPCSAPESVR